MEPNRHVTLCAGEIEEYQEMNFWSSLRFVLSNLIIFFIIWFEP